MHSVSRTHSVDRQQALVQHPLMVGPDTPVGEAIAQMNAPPGDAAPLSDCPLAQAARIQAARRSCVLIVVNQQPIGIFTERDVVRLSAQGHPCLDQPIATVMVQPVQCLPEADVTDCAVALTWLQHHGLSHLPMVDVQGQVVGLVTPATLLGACSPSPLGGDPAPEPITPSRGMFLSLAQQVTLRTAALKQQADREQLLREIATRIRASLNLQTTLATVVNEVRRFLGCDRTVIYQFSDDWSGAITAESVDPAWPAILGQTIAGPCFQAEAKALYQQGTKQAVSDIYQAGYPDGYIATLERFQIKAHLVVPILVQNQLWGLLMSHQCRAPHPWQPTDLDLLDSIALQVAIAIQHAQIYERSQAELHERQRRERETQLLHSITQAISLAEDMETALSAILQQICEAMGWAYGEVWLPSPDQTMLRVATMGYSHNPALQPFRQAARALPMALGKGLPGRVWQTQAPEWWSDLAHAPANQFLRQAVACQVGLRSGFALPIQAHNSVVAILCFYATEPREHDPTVVQITQSITTQLEQIVRRKQLECDRQTAMNALQQLNCDLENRIEQRTIDLRNSEARFRRLFEQNPIGLVVTDLTGQITRINTSLKKILGYSEAEFLQMSVQDLVVTASASSPFEQSEDWLDDLQDSTLSSAMRETQLRAKHKPPIWATITSSLILNTFGRPSDIVHLIEDISQRKQAEANLAQVTLALQESEEKFRQLAENIDGVFWIRDLSGQILYISPAYETIWQRSVAQLYEDPASWLEALYPDDCDRLMAQVQKNTAFDEEYRIQLPNGEVRWIRDRGFLVHNRQGEVYRCAGIAEDISDRKRSEAERQAVEEALRRQLTAIEAAIDGIAILAGDTYTYVNRAHLDLFGYEHPEELVGQSWQKLYSTEELARFEHEVVPVLMEKRYWQGEAIATRKDGSTFSEGLSLTLTDQGEVICVCRDITAQKQAALQLQQTNEQLILSNAELARATRLKDEFLANMSHELRTPLNAILGMTEGLQEQVFGPVSPEQERAIATIERSGRHLLDLINDILDLAKIESGKLELQIAPAAVTYLCESSLTFVRQQAIQKHIRLITRVPDHLPDLAVDELRLRQVLINLLNNAVKFTPEGGTVCLEVSTTFDPPTDVIFFKVQDTGIGIIPEHLDQLFKPFVQVDSSLTRQHCGTGLGLALVRQLVDLHGGTTTVTSTPGQGSCFTVRLPYRGGSLAPAPAPSPALPAPRPPGSTVLLIEDMPSATEQISRYLGEFGLQVISCGLGQAALALAQQQPALIILDLMLPDVSGTEVLAQLKADPQTQAIPVLVTSVLEERSQSMAQGAFAYLVKPITRQALHQALTRLPLGKLTPPPLPPPQTSLSAPLILLAEDNAANRATLSGYLSHRGFRLVVAENGQEAVAMSQTHQPDLVVMDVQMPVLDGLSAIRQIRAQPATATVPIVALTALAMPRDRDQCLAAGANDYLTKPVRMKTLVDVMRRLLEEVSPCQAQP